MFSVDSLVVGVVSTNCYIAADTETREAAVIDPGDKAGLILGRVREKGLTLRYIFLTHGHFDHTLALEEVRRATGAKAVIHEADAVYLRDAGLSGPFGRAKAITAEADVLTRHGETFPLGAYTFEVLHTPGHTPGSICLRVPAPEGGTAGVLFTGDTLFEDDCGRCDLPGGDYAAMLASLRLLASLEGDYTVYPGHDVATTLSRERKRNVNMREALEG
ncbi:MAG: MBL fold metallo-hydrolase [Oscillospiraceae bacterium]|jgi:glyoxylase-like metal-dependent hydrolase (beta-lactamase superfamily II)|nr:MBL fold metallo-hydrolase [Oscillospiraceae bacterium]